MSLANSNGPQWIRAQHAETKKRWEGIAPIRAFLLRIFGAAETRPVDAIPRPEDHPST